jgi:hypothetical protein
MGGLLAAGIILASALLLAPAAQADWLAPLDISQPTEHAGVPQVVLDAQGNATAVWELWNGEDTVVESAYRPAGGSWQVPTTLSLAPGEVTLVAGEHDAQGPRIAVDGQGNTTVVWTRSAGTNRLIVQALYRPAGGSWQAPVNIGEVDTERDPEPWAAVDEQGDATVVWDDAGVLESAYRPVDGSWEAPIAVSGGEEAFVPQAAVDAQGDATAVWMAHDGSRYVVESAYRPAGGGWEAPTELSQAGEEGGDPDIALDARGDTMVVWDGHGGGEAEAVRAAYRPASGTWQTPANLSQDGDEAQSLQVALDAQGDALVVWSDSTREVGGYSIVQAAYLPAGGSWEAPVALSAAGENAFPSDVVFDQSGNAAVVWERSNGTNDIVQAAYRPSDGGWQKPTSLSAEGQDGTDAVIVLDAPGDSTAADGDATAVWTSSEGGCSETPRCATPPTYAVQAAGYDPVEPGEVQAPTTGEVGAPISFSASSRDAWSPVLSFGDGASATSTSATHTYSAPGEYEVTFSSTDVLGYRRSTQRTIVIAPATAPPEPSGTTSENSGSEAGTSKPATGQPGASNTAPTPATAAIALATGSDAQATHAYLIAQYKLGTALLHGAAAARGAESAAAAQIARECPGVVSGMPQEPSLKPFPAPPPRVRGENARRSQQKQTIEDELGAVVARAGNSSYRPAEEAYVAEVRQLSWSNPAIASALQAASTARLEAVSAPAPPFCADARAWAQSGYRALPVASREFEASRAARRRAARAEERSLGALLKPYENAPDRALIRKTNALENRLLASAGAAVRTFFSLERIVGFPKVGAEPPKPIALGHGRTAAGTRFQVSGSRPLGTPGSCHGSATVAYTRPGAPEVLIVGGPNNPICLSSPRYRHPALFCEVGIETIQTAVPASVRSVRLVLADGRTIESRVVRVPRRDGGPAGVYAQEIRGSTSHAASLVELNAGGGVVLTVALPRYRCVKSRKEPEEPLTVTELASGHTPEGETFTISTFGSINGEPSLSVDTGVDPELNEPTIGLGASKAFPWSLSIGCTPHPYAILYGILVPPGKSVVAQTPQGAVTLNVVPVEPHVHAKGPLVYGVFSALPSELTVLGASGSTVYTENLQAKATEAAQFCEGYAEP